MDIVSRLKFDAARCEVDYSKGVASNIEEAVAEIERLRRALYAIIDLDHHNHGPKSRATGIAQDALNGPTGRD